MAVHLINKPIVFPPIPEDTIAPPASGASSDQDPDNPKLPVDRLPTVITLKGLGELDKPGKIQTRWLDNSFQKALLRAQERLTGGALPREQEEWRLPHAPVPSRPDFSRVVPYYDESSRKKKRGKHKRSDTYPKISKEKSSEPEYILPPIPIPTLFKNAVSDMSINFPSTKLSQNIVTSSQPVYLPFVGSASLHPKSTTETVIRERQYHLPGLCHGCRDLTHLHDFKGYLYLDGEYGDVDVAASESGKGGSIYDNEADEEGMMGAVGMPVGASLCHGCSISEVPHFHYISQDGNSVLGKAPPPSEWSSNDSGLHDSISQSQYSASVSQSQYSASVYGFFSSPSIATAPPEEMLPVLRTEEAFSQESESVLKTKSTTEKDPSEVAEEEHGHGRVLFSVEKISDPDVPIHQHTVPRKKPPKLPQWIMDLIKDGIDPNAAQKIRHYEDHCYACEQALHQLLPDNPLLRQLMPQPNAQPGKFLGNDLHHFKHVGPMGDNSEAASTSGIGTSIISEGDIFLHVDEEEDLEERKLREKERLEEERIQKEEAEKERRKKLYQAPKAFKPKKTESTITKGEDPFSKERSYNIPKNSGFKIKKSDKGPTTHVDIKRDDRKWEAPKKFELKKGPSNVTKSDWKFSEKKERLRPPTPPPPPPPIKKKQSTVPIETKKREPPKPIASLKAPPASPPRKKKVEEKPKLPEKKPVKEPEPKKVIPKPEPKKVIPKPEPKKVVKVEPEPKKKVEPEPKKEVTVQPPAGMIKLTKPEPKKVTKVVKLPTKVKKLKKKPKPKKIKKRKKQKPKEEEEEESSDEELVWSPSPEPYEPDRPLPPSPPPTPPTPSQFPLPPSPTPDQIPLPPSRSPTPTPPPPKEPTPPPKELTPLPPKEPTPPPPKEPTPPPKEPSPPPKDPTPPPPPVKKPPKPKPVVSKPVKPKKAPKPKKEKKKQAVNRKVVTRKPPPQKAPAAAKPAAQNPASEPAEVTDRESEQGATDGEVDVTKEPESEPEVEEESEPEPPAAVVQKPKKMPKLPKASFKKRVPLIIKDWKRKEKTITAPWLMPKIPKWKDGSDVDLPDWPEGEMPPEIKAMIERQAPPLPKIPEPKPKTPEPEPEPVKKLPPAPKVAKKPPPIMFRKRREYKPKRRKMRVVKKESPPSSPEPEMRDALDFLAKYCIVLKERVPQYQYVFNRHLEKQGVIVNPEEDDEDKDNEDDEDAEPEGRPYRLKSLTGSETTQENAAVTDSQQDHEFEETFKRGPGFEEDTAGDDNYVSPLNLTSTDKVGETKSESGETMSDDSGESNAPKKVVLVNPPQTSIEVDDRLDKIAFTVDNLYQKTINLEDEILQQGGSRKVKLANLAREEFPEILSADYTPKSRANSPKKDKKGKKTKKKTKDNNDTSAVIFGMSPLQPRTPIKTYPDDDHWVLGRLDEFQNQQLEEMSEVRSHTLRLERAKEKLVGAKTRMRELLKEKDVVLQIGQEIQKMESSSRPAADDEFRRKQSSLYKNMNPEQIHEIGVKDVEPLMRLVNRNLITDKECQYVYHVLDLPQRHRLNFKLFTVVAALSEKVANLEPFIRKLINKMDFEALDVKMSKAKELFYLLDDDDSDFSGSGEIPLRNMNIELEAGGLSADHVNMVVDKFAREGKHTVDFLDFLTYILLFLDIHDHILSDPLNSSRDR